MNFARCNLNLQVGLPFVEGIEEVGKRAGGLVWVRGLRDKRFWAPLAWPTELRNYQIDRAE